MFNFIRNHKVLSLMGVLNVLMVLVAILIIVVHHTKTATIDIMVAPSEATIELNGKKYENLESYNIMPGDYHVKVAMEGMQTREYDMNLADGGFARIWTYLVDADGGFEYYMMHPDDAAILEDVADKDAEAFVEKYTKMMSITEVLPLTLSNRGDNTGEIISIHIRWGTEDECREKPYCLIVKDFTGKNTERALAMIREAGYDPDDYEIIFKEGLE